MRCKYINPKVLRWARESAGYPLKTVANHSAFKKVAEWEKGTTPPTYNQLKGLASYYQRPLALLFFPEVPYEDDGEEKIKVSFRSLPAKQLQALPPSVKLLLRKGRCFQSGLHKLTDGFNPAHKLTMPPLQLTDRRNVRDWALKARDLLGIDINQQKKWKSENIAFNKWRDVFAKNGIFVFKAPFKEDAYSGFCLYDKDFPVIFVNSSVSYTRQIFTLSHELAHLLSENNHIDITTSDTGVSYFDDITKSYQDIEQLCNDFAAEFLLPTSDFVKTVEDHDTTQKSVAKLARQYCVSREVVVRKMLTHDYIDKDTYHKYKTILIASRQKQKKGRGGCSFYRKKISQLGKAYLELVLEKYDQQKISISEAANYLDIKPRCFDQLEDEFYRSKKYEVCD